MNNKGNSVGPALIIIVLLIFWTACSKNNPTPAIGPDPKVTSVDKNYVINGAIIRIRGYNFTKDSTGSSQVIATHVSDTSKHPYSLSILKRTSSEIVAVMKGAGDGFLGEYNLSYYSKTDTVGVIYPSIVYTNVVQPATGQFNVSSTFINNSLTAGTIASFGAKNGSLKTTDYSVILVSYDSITGGVPTKASAVVDSVHSTKFDGLMDKVDFIVPAVPAGKYHVKVIYSYTPKDTLIAGWNTTFKVN